MSNLLDRVLKNKDAPTADQLLSPRDDKPHALSDGSVVYDSTFAAIERILSINHRLHKRQTTFNNWALYNGHKPVDLTNRQTFLSLLRADWTPATPWQTVYLIEQIMERVPTLSKDCFVISEGLIWDREAGKLKTYKEEDNIRTVS